MNIEERFNRILVEHLGIDRERISPEAMLEDDLGADSLDIVELQMSVEEEFEIAIPDEEWRRGATVATCIQLIERKLAAKMPAAA